MRLRNIPRADDTLQAHFTVIKNPKEFRGNWTSVFGNDRPIRIEIGMGKGRFLLNMAKTYPNINFIGIERYSSVLLRAVEKFDTEEFQICRISALSAWMQENCRKYLPNQKSTAFT